MSHMNTKGASDIFRSYRTLRRKQKQKLIVPDAPRSLRARLWALLRAPFTR